MCKFDFPSNLTNLQNIFMLAIVLVVLKIQIAREFIIYLIYANGNSHYAYPIVRTEKLWRRCSYTFHSVELVCLQLELLEQLYNNYLLVESGERSRQRYSVHFTKYIFSFTTILYYFLLKYSY